MMRNIYCDGRGIRFNRDDRKVGDPEQTVLIIEFTGDEKGRAPLKCMGIKTPGPSLTIHDLSRRKDGGRITIWREVEGPLEILHPDGTWEMIP